MVQSRRGRATIRHLGCQSSLIPFLVLDTLGPWHPLGQSSGTLGLFISKLRIGRGPRRECEKGEGASAGGHEGGKIVLPSAGTALGTKAPYSCWFSYGDQVALTTPNLAGVAKMRALNG